MGTSYALFHDLLQILCAMVALAVRSIVSMQLGCRFAHGLSQILCTMVALAVSSNCVYAAWLPLCPHSEAHAAHRHVPPATGQPVPERP